MIIHEVGPNLIGHPAEAVETHDVAGNRIDVTQSHVDVLVILDDDIYPPNPIFPNVSISVRVLGIVGWRPL